MSLITTRSGKGASLTHSELDGNFPKDAQTKAANYTVAVGDNRDTIEVTATANISLPDAAGIVAASDTGDFEVTIKNISGITTISRVTAGDTIDGVASDILMSSKEGVTYKVNQAGNGYNIISNYAKGLVILDNPVLLLDTTSAPTNPTSIGHTILTSENAKKAIIEVKTVIYSVTTDSDFSVYAKNDSSVAFSEGYQKALTLAVSGANGSDRNQFTVNLDTNNDFWYLTFGSGTSTKQLIMYIVGYYV